MRQYHVHDTVLLSGWLFADLLLGLTIIFLIAVPGIMPKPIELAILTVRPTSLDPTNPQCSGGISDPQCTITLSVSRSKTTWSASSDMSDTIGFSPASGTLLPGETVTVTIKSIPCHNGSFTFSGPEAVRPVTVSWSCTPPPERLDFAFQSFDLNVSDINGLLADSQSTIDDIKQQVKSQPIFDGRSVGLAIVYGGAPTVDDIPRAREIARKIYRILTLLGQEGFAFQKSTNYQELYNFGTNASRAEVHVYFFKK